MTAGCTLLSLESLGALRAHGRDTSAFLQGQLSADVSQLAADRSLLAGYHNPQGRVLALLRLFEVAPGEVLAVLPRELVAVVLARLSTFILRSKVVLTDDSAHWRFEGLVGPVATPESPFAAHLPLLPGGVARLGDSVALRVGEGRTRWLIATPSVGPAQQPNPALVGCEAAPPELWRRLGVEAGEPQVYASTSGEFVAQMLNLDAVGAIAFDKGCYTGQEVIARAHYRGRVKRRLQRFRTAQPLALAPGDSGELTDGSAFRVVEAVRTADQGCEFLAVAPLVTADAGAQAEASPPGNRARARVEAVRLPLPYALPD
jgi:folate-binding protein YgfZ